MLDGGAQRGELHASGHGVLGEQADRLQKRRAAALEGAERTQRRGERHPQLHLAIAIVRGEQPQRRLEPARRRGRPSARRLRAGRHQHGDGLLVALPGRLLHVVRALTGGGSARGEGGGRPAVRREPPAAAGGFVDRPAHQWMPEGEAPRHLGRPHEVHGQQVVEGIQPLRIRELGHGGREIRLEGLARHRRAVEQPARRRRQRLQLLEQRGRHGRGHPGLAVAVRDRGGDRLALLVRPRELLEVERVPAPVAVHVGERTRVHVAEQLPRLRLTQLLQADSEQGRHRQRPRQAFGGLAAAERERHEHRRLRAAPQQRGEQLDRSGVGPMEVVQHQHERARLREPLEQGAHRAVRPVALVRQRGPRLPAGAAEAGQHAGELVQQRGVPPVARGGLLGGHIRVEGVRPDPERNVALELGGRPGQHHVPARVRALAQLGEQASLADSGLALGADEGGRALGQRVERPFELIELCLATDGLPCC